MLVIYVQGNTGETQIPRDMRAGHTLPGETYITVTTGHPIRVWGKYPRGVTVAFFLIFGRAVDPLISKLMV